MCTAAAVTTFRAEGSLKDSHGRAPTPMLFRRNWRTRGANCTPLYGKIRVVEFYKIRKIFA